MKDDALILGINHVEMDAVVPGSYRRMLATKKKDAVLISSVQQTDK